MRRLVDFIIIFFIFFVWVFALRPMVIIPNKDIDFIENPFDSPRATDKCDGVLKKGKPVIVTKCRYTKSFLVYRVKTTDGRECWVDNDDFELITGYQNIKNLFQTRISCY